MGRMILNWYVKFLKLAAFRNKVLMLAKKLSTQLYTDIINKFENKQLQLGQISIDQNQEEELRNYNPEISPSVQNNAPSSLMECVYDARDYLLNESEIEAYIREFMDSAKHNGTILEDLIEELIRSEISKCNPVEINNHINQRTETGIRIEEIIKEINTAYQNRIGTMYSNRRRRNT